MLGKNQSKFRIRMLGCIPQGIDSKPLHNHHVPIHFGQILLDLCGDLGDPLSLMEKAKVVVDKKDVENDRHRDQSYKETCNSILLMNTH